MQNTFNIAGVHDIGFLDTQFSSSCQFYICSSLALKIHSVIEDMLKERCVKFSGILMSSFEIITH